MLTKFSRLELTKTYRHLSIEDTNILKGISILLIGFHNFYRNIEPHFGENEFYFDRNHLSEWINYVTQNPSEWFMSFFSFLGHYGVSAFVLISGYGLAMGFKKKKFSVISFYISRLKKIYPTFFLGIVIAVIVALISNTYPIKSELWEAVFWKISLLSPFNPKMQYALYGPWWFFGLIFHLYALFPLLLFLLRKNFKIIFWLILGVLFILPHTNLLVLTYFHNSENYYASALYQLPLFGTGVFLGYNKNLILPKLIFIPALFFLLYGQGNFVVWKLTHISAAILIVILVINLREKQWQLNKLLTVCGILSFHFFVIHPVIRPPFIEIAKSINSIYFTTFMGFVFVGFSYCTAWIFKIIDNKFRKILSIE